MVHQPPGWYRWKRNGINGVSDSVQVNFGGVYALALAEHQETVGITRGCPDPAPAGPWE